VSLAPDRRHVEDAPPPRPPRPAGEELAFRVARNAGVLAASHVLVRGLGMGMMIVLARYLGPEPYGIYQRSEAFVFLFSIVVNLGLDMILTREVARHPARASEYFSGIVVCKALTGLVAYALVISIAAARGYSGDFLWGIRVFGIVLLANSLSETCSAVFQGLQEMRYMALAQIAAQGIFLTLGLTFVLMGRSLHWILGALVLGSLVQCAFSATVLRRSFHLRWIFPGFATVRFLLRESIPLALAASFALIYQQIDAVLLGEFKGNAEVGWYKAGAKFLLVFTVLRDSLMVSIYPVFASLGASDRPRLATLLSRVVRYQMGIALYFVLGFVLLSRLAPALLGADYHNSGSMLPILGWILLPQTISIACGRALIASGDQARMMFSTFSSLAVNVALNVWWIPRYGIMGAAAAGVASEIVVAGLNVWLVRRYIGPTRFVRELWRPVAAAALAGAVMIPLRHLSLFLGFPLLALAYGLSLLLFRAVSRDELGQLGRLVRAWLAATKIRGRLPARWVAKSGSWLGEREP
jgi:O-antigen/teichoic acid export membrane protein